MATVSPDGASIPIITVDAPATAATTEKFVSGDTWITLFGSDPKVFEGYFLRVQDDNGNPIYMSGNADRAGAAVGWVRPDLYPPQWQQEAPPAPTSTVG